MWFNDKVLYLHYEIDDKVIRDIRDLSRLAEANKTFNDKLKEYFDNLITDKEISGLEKSVSEYQKNKKSIIDQIDLLNSQLTSNKDQNITDMQQTSDELQINIDINEKQLSQKKTD